MELKLTEEQSRVVKAALDFYIRIGIGQFDRIKDHPTFERRLEEACVPVKEIAVGDRTKQGVILSIIDGKALINGSVKNGKWCSDREWKNVEDVKLSPDWDVYHKLRDEIDNDLYKVRDKLCNYPFLTGSEGSWGIHYPNVDESCRIAYEIYDKLKNE